MTKYLFLTILLISTSAAIAQEIDKEYTHQDYIDAGEIEADAYDDRQRNYIDEAGWNKPDPSSNGGEEELELEIGIEESDEEE